MQSATGRFETRFICDDAVASKATRLLGASGPTEPPASSSRCSTSTHHWTAGTACVPCAGLEDRSSCGKKERRGRLVVHGPDDISAVAHVLREGRAERVSRAVEGKLGVYGFGEGRTSLERVVNQARCSSSAPRVQPAYTAVVGTSGIGTGFPSLELRVNTFKNSVSGRPGRRTLFSKQTAPPSGSAVPYPAQ